MIYIIADNITSPLGATTGENLEAILQGRSALRRHEGLVPELWLQCIFQHLKQ